MSQTISFGSSATVNWHIVVMNYELIGLLLGFALGVGLIKINLYLGIVWELGMLFNLGFWITKNSKLR